MDEALIEAVCQAMPEPVTPYWKDRQRIAEEVIPVVLERCQRVVHEQRCQRRTPWDNAILAASEAIRNLGASQ